MYGLDQLGFTLRVLHASLLLPLYPRNKHLQKFFRLHVDADLGVGRDLVETLDHQTVAIGKMMQHVPFNLVPPVGHGFSPRETPPRLATPGVGGPPPRAPSIPPPPASGSYIGVPLSPNFSDSSTRNFVTP